MASHNFLVSKRKRDVEIISDVCKHNDIQPPVDFVVDVCACDVTPKLRIRDIGVSIDDTMPMTGHVRPYSPGGIQPHSQPSHDQEMFNNSRLQVKSPCHRNIFRRLQQYEVM